MNMINELTAGPDNKHEFDELAIRMTTTEVKEIFDDDEIWNNSEMETSRISLNDKEPPS